MRIPCSGHWTLQRLSSMYPYIHIYYIGAYLHYFDDPRRWMMFPLQYPQVWEMLHKREASFWATEKNLSQNSRDWNTLAVSEQYFTKHVLTLWAFSW